MDPKKLANSLNDFPTLPTIYSKLLEVLSNMNTKVSEVADLISKDQATVMKVLKTANSSFYGFEYKVTNITHAITLLGFNEIKSIVMSLSFINLFKNTRLYEIINPVDFWKHSIGTAIISRRIGISLGAITDENFFLSGLLHDIGKLFFYLYFTIDYGKVLNYQKNRKVSILEAEKEILGYTHCEIGEQIAKKWKLPDNITNAIKFHHNGLIYGKEFELQTACVHLANIASKMLNFGESGYSNIERPNPLIWEHCNMQPGMFVSNLTTILDDYNDAIKLFLLT